MKTIIKGSIKMTGAEPFQKMRIKEKAVEDDLEEGLEEESPEELPEKPSCSGAYFTVEAALVMPVVLCILVMVIYLSFYLYDRCVMAQDCYVLSYRQSIEKGKADRISQEKIRSQYGNKLFMLSALETGSSSGGTICVRSNARMSPPLFGLPVFEQEREWDLGVERKAKKTDPPKDFRRVRRTLFLASKVLPDGKAGE